MILDATDNDTFGIEAKDGWFAPDTTEGLEDGLFMSERYSEVFGKPVVKETIAIYNDTRLVVEHCDDGAVSFEYPSDRDELGAVVTELMADE